MTSGELLLYGGAALMVIAAVGALVAVVLFAVSKKRLQARLNEEFGKKRH